MSVVEPIYLGLNDTVGCLLLLESLPQVGLKLKRRHQSRVTVVQSLAKLVPDELELELNLQTAVTQDLL